ncbi:MAG TPA: alkaline phosphatase D family protein [Gemmatimonadaceae bacterium]|nr:alkaline phosphatase D family protein [Gemmatimonadaceae bacterium]
MTDEPRANPDDVMSRPMTRREALTTAAALGVSLAWPWASARESRTNWRQRAEYYPQGVASGDPVPDGVILWTRRPPVGDRAATTLVVEVSEDADFARIISTSRATISANTDWTCRVMVAGLSPSRTYWYRFTDEHGFGSRVGRTITAPAANDPRPARFAFVSCQNMQLGACNAYRRMIWDDERRDPADRLGFVLHLGDFVYEIIWYPEDRPQGYYARRIRDIVRYAAGEKHADFHVPTTVDDYRSLYRAYLLDPDLQDARARWPFVCMPDNHEFSWKGWQTQENFGAGTLPAQTRKVAANQAWFEYQPGRVAPPGMAITDPFHAPPVANQPLTTFDPHGLGLDSGNLAAIDSLRFYRSMRWGANVDLILTDNRSYRSEPLSTRPESAPFQPTGFPAVVSEDVTEILDAGREFDNGNPPATIAFNGEPRPNPRRDAPPLSMLGARQKTWFLEQLRSANARWKVWGNSVAMLDWRIDFQNLPADNGPRWPTTGYALFSDDDWSGYRHERAEIFRFVREHGITGLATVCGDRHSFLAGLLSPTVSPKSFDPVGVEFVTGSISAPGLAEAMEYSVPPTHPLRAIYVYRPSPSDPAQPAVNLSIMTGVRASLELQRTHRMSDALAVANKEVAPHLSFADVGGHGYAVVTASPAELNVEFVCIPRPIERAKESDGGPVSYRVGFRVPHWDRGSAPRMTRTVIEGTLPLVP